MELLHLNGNSFHDLGDLCDFHFSRLRDLQCRFYTFRRIILVVVILKAVEEFENDCRDQSNSDPLESETDEFTIATRSSNKVGKLKITAIFI